jgi:hypothetical protein
LTADGSEIIGNQPDQFTKFLISDSKRWGAMIPQMEIKGD